ncbi:extracellular solute-binding protein [Butyrivibrio sp. LC3010]|uniref:extracellular solute-binding protein n=1 Tax=Butyrivibrio sp. LC3010 TaxID=1280680 RepID=UPI0004126A2D|nr:extracellular solute-binding protein [Butyrivibrio sp. LC3010]
MKKSLVATISFLLSVCILTGCRLPFSVDNRTEGEHKYPEFLTIDVYDTQANTQGLQRGWFAKIVRDKFNMQLNIISTNIDDNSDATYETMRASGNLGDIIITNVDHGRLSDLVREGLVLDMTGYLEKCDNLNKFKDQIAVTSAFAGVDGNWAVPSEIAEYPATEPSEAIEPTNAPTIRWDLYKRAGYPKVNTLEDLLPVLRKMQNLAIQSDIGRDVYAFSLFGDWDGAIMQNAGALASLYGYDPQEFIMLNPETGEIQDITDSDSIYFKMLHFLFEANQMGLVDPDSPYQNYETVAAKFREGAVLYSFWPWMGESLYNSDEHLAVGKGFASIGIEDASYICWGNDPNGKQSFSIMVGQTTKDPQRMVDFIDWLYSDEGTECCGSPTGDFRGPRSLTWESTEDGPILTQFGIDAFITMDENLEVPEEFGGGTWKEGVSALNFKPVDMKNIDSDGVPFSYQAFDDYQEKTASSISDDWQRHYKTDKTPIEYFEEREMISVIPGTEWAAGDYPEYLKTVELQCRQTVNDYSWKMVFAESEEEFENLKETMISTLVRLGSDKVVEINRENAKNRYEILRNAAGGKS